MGACFVLFVKSGRLFFLEGATFGDDKWPKNVTNFKLGYDRGTRDLATFQTKYTPY